MSLPDFYYNNQQYLAFRYYLDPLVYDLIEKIYKKYDTAESGKDILSKEYLTDLLMSSGMNNKLHFLEDEIIEELSERELDVLRASSLGLTNQEISEKLYISVNTVKTHLKSINRKLGSRNRTDALRKAQLSMKGV